MPVTAIWDASAPLGSDDPRDGDDELRNIKLGVYERLPQGGIYWDNAASADTNAGKIAAGVQATNKLYLYETDLTTAMATFDDSAETLTLGDGAGGSNTYQLICDSISATSATFTGAVTSDNTTCQASAEANSIGVTLTAGGGLQEVDTVTITPGDAIGGLQKAVMVGAYLMIQGSGGASTVEGVEFAVDRDDDTAFSALPGALSLSEVDPITAPTNGGSDYLLLNYCFIDTSAPASNIAGTDCHYRLRIKPPAAGNNLIVKYTMWVRELV